MSSRAEPRIPSCALCPRRCGADRITGVGRCGAGGKVRLARAQPHFWEEPCISGTGGAGAVFFSGCPLGCIFCQNEKISTGNFGREISAERLAEIFIELQSAGVHNIDLVNPTHYVPWILNALEIAAPDLRIPIVYNSGGYETSQTLAALEQAVDIYLPDLKFHDPVLSQRYCDAPDYFAYASEAIRQMVNQAGPPRFDGQGMMTRGVIVRLLVMPGARGDAKRLLDWLSATFKPDGILLSLMSQYTPTAAVRHLTPLSRRVSTFEYNDVLQHARKCGFKGFMQERESARASYTPDFSLQGV